MLVRIITLQIIMGLLLCGLLSIGLAYETHQKTIKEVTQ